MPVFDQSNYQTFLETGKVETATSLKEPAKEPDPKEPEAKGETEIEAGDEALSEAVRKRIGKEVYKRRQADAAVKKAETARQEADENARSERWRAQEAERERDELKARVAENERAKTPVESAKEPVREDFKTDAEYWDAKIDWKADQKVKAAEARRAAEDAQKLAIARDSARIERNKVFAATVDDWQETTDALAAAVPDAPPGYIQEYILESEASAAVMYHFGKNPDEYLRIVALSPIKAIAEIGKLEARLDAAKGPAKTEPKVDPKPVERTRAPDPITPIASNIGGVEKPLSEMNTRETIEYWARQEKTGSGKRQRH